MRKKYASSFMGWQGRPQSGQTLTPSLSTSWLGVQKDSQGVQYMPSYSLL